MVVINEKNFIALWHVELDRSNFVGTLTKNPTREMEFTYRFRRKDEKCWYSRNMNKSQAEALEICRAYTANLASWAKGPVCEIEMGQGIDGVLAKIHQLPQFHWESWSPGQDMTLSRVPMGAVGQL
jgi:hypothetical protein